jgi:hypothetical protein
VRQLYRGGAPEILGLIPRATAALSTLEFSRRLFRCTAAAQQGQQQHRSRAACLMLHLRHLQLCRPSSCAAVGRSSFRILAALGTFSCKHVMPQQCLTLAWSAGR